MPSHRSNRKPTFLWQAVLIVLPVIVLATVGFVSLRQDKLLARKEAEERAQHIADDLSGRIWQELAASNRPAHSFQVDDEGNLVFPPSLAPLPEPKPLKLADLTADQLRLWQKTVAAEANTANRGAAIQAYREFLDSNPHVRFAAVAEYALGMLLFAGDEKKDAVECFRKIIENYPDSRGESGLPLAPLAELRLLELTEFGAYDPARIDFGKASADPVFSRHNLFASTVASAAITNRFGKEYRPSFDSFCSNLVYNPSPLSPLLLEASLKHFIAGTDFSDRIHPNTNHYWLDIWRQHEYLRGLYEAALPSLAASSKLFWFRSGGESWLADAKPIIGKRAEARQNPSQITTGEAIRRLRGKIELRAVPSQNYVRADVPPLDLPAEGVATNISILCRSESEIRQQVAAALSAEQKIPDYLGVGVEIAGRPLGGLNSDLRPWKEVNYAGKGGGVKKEFLSDFPVPMIAINSSHAGLLASAIHSEAGADLLKVGVYLTSPDQLFKRQTARTFWFGSLIAASALAAFVGLLTAWRAFSAQQRLSDMKSNFVSSVSHELRAPIASVRLLAESLEKGKITEPQKQFEYFRFIGQECRRLSGLIQNVLDFSRIEQGRKQYEFEPTDMMALVRETVALMQTYAAEKQVSLRLDLGAMSAASEKLELSVDSRAIQQALINLVDNAIKHSLKGSEVIVGVTGQRENQPPDSASPRENVWSSKCAIWVEDKGPGIPLEEQEKIFERFYRVGSELRRETQGVGIGLSIVKHVVEAHGGRVRVRSAPGQGSQFTIELPTANTASENH